MIDKQKFDSKRFFLMIEHIQFANNQNKINNNNNKNKLNQMNGKLNLHDFKCKKITRLVCFAIKNFYSAFENNSINKSC